MKKYIYFVLSLLVLSLVFIVLRFYFFSVIGILICVIILIIAYKRFICNAKELEFHLKNAMSKNQFGKFILQKDDELVFVKEQLNNLFEIIEPLILNGKDVVNRVRDIINVINSPILLLDSKGRIVLYNKASEIFMRGKCNDCSYFEALKNMSLIDIVGHCINSNVNNRDVKIEESIYRVNSFQKADLAGEKLIFCIFTDITLLKKKNNLEREFISSVSHELKTPLSVISGAVDIISEKDVLPEERMKFVRIIKDNSERMNNLIKKLLILTEIRSTEKIKKKRVNLKNCVESILRTELDRAKQKSIFVKTNLEDVWVMGNEFLLLEMIRNIADNAIKYTDKGMVEIIVIRDSFAIITIRDSGPGISKELLPHIFEPFYRADKSRARISGGTGLGLTIARRIALLHKGNITVKSSVGKGTEFTIQLPAL